MKKVGNVRMKLPPSRNDKSDRILGPTRSIIVWTFPSKTIVRQVYPIHGRTTDTGLPITTDTRYQTTLVAYLRRQSVSKRQQRPVRPNVQRRDRPVITTKLRSTPPNLRPKGPTYSRDSNDEPVNSTHPGLRYEVSICTYIRTEDRILSEIVS